MLFFRSINVEVVLQKKNYRLLATENSFRLSSDYTECVTRVALEEICIQKRIQIEFCQEFDAISPASALQC